MTRPELFDLHVHSVASDGVHSLLELAERARRAGLAGFAITDHDILPTPASLEDIKRCSTTEVLPGVELSTQLDQHSLHLLGYGCNVTDPLLHRLCSDIALRRRERWVMMVEHLRSKGLQLDWQRLDRLGESPRPGRLHLARELVRAGHATSVRVAFFRWLGKLGAEAPVAIAFDQALSAIHSAGGAAVLAHPPESLSTERWQSMIDAGIDGIETSFPGVTRRRRRALEQLAQRHDLIPTAGSDFHGGDNRNPIGAFNVEREVLEDLLHRTDRWSVLTAQQGNRVPTTRR
jgi:predicted metal-dependent phosphoesterase TrpH